MFSSLLLKSTLKPSPLIREEGFVQHVFKWGVGNKFRSLSKNRFRPVHHYRPKEVTISSDYFSSPFSNMKYDPLNEAWEVYWTENMKANAKPFPVKKFGVEQSKIEAKTFAEKITSSHNIQQSNRLGVFWDDRMQCWFSLNSRKGFSAIKHGNETAKNLAETAQGTDQTEVGIARVLHAIETRK